MASADEFKRVARHLERFIGKSEGWAERVQSIRRFLNYLEKSQSDEPAGEPGASLSKYPHTRRGCGLQRSADDPGAQSATESQSGATPSPAAPSTDSDTDVIEVDEFASQPEDAVSDMTSQQSFEPPSSPPKTAQPEPATPAKKGKDKKKGKATKAVNQPATRSPSPSVSHDLRVRDDRTSRTSINLMC